MKQTLTLLIVAVLFMHFFKNSARLVTRLDEDVRQAKTRLVEQVDQHNREQHISQQAQAFNQTSDIVMEELTIEVRQNKKDPWTAQSVPVSAAERLWQRTERTRAAAVPATAGQSDRIKGAAAAGQATRDAER